MFAALAAFAQTAPDTTTDAANASAGDPLTTLRAMKHKTLVFVFDVSGSMNDKGNLRRARQATIDLLREGVSTGDQEHVAGSSREGSPSAN